MVAGVSVGLVLIPQAMAYAELAGLPSHRGLYAAALPLLAATLFASSPYLQTGPVALTALLTLGALVPLAPVSTPEYVGLAALLALVVGLVRLFIGVVKAGWISYLMSRPMLMGFTTGAALLILASQVPGAFGVEPPSAGVLGSSAWVLAHPGSWEPASMALTTFTVAVILVGRRLHHLVPGVLLATVGGLAFSVLSGYGGPTVGEIPRGFVDATLALPWRSLPALALPGTVIALVGFAEVAAISRAFAARERQPWDPSREFVSQGAANLASALAGGFPVGGSFSRSGVGYETGARSRWSGGVAGLFVLAFLPFAGILSPLPRAVLAGIVIATVAGLVHLIRLAGLWRLSKAQAAVAWATFLLCLVLAPRIDQAVVFGILMALAVHVLREMKGATHSWTEGTTVHLDPRGVLWFGSAPSIEKDLLRRLAEADDVERVVIHLRGLGRIDLTGALVLKEVIADATAAGLETELAEVPPHAHRILARVLDWRPPSR